MKLGKKYNTLSNPLDEKIFNELDLLSKKLNHSLDESLKIDLKFFLQKGLVCDNIEHFFKERYDSNIQLNNFETKLALMSLRYPFVEKFGFVLLSDKLLDKTSIFLKNKSVCEIGAGTGWLSHNLQKYGVNIIPVDYKSNNNSDFGFKKLHTEVLIQDGIDYLKNNMHDVIILSWPDYDTSFASDILKTLKKGQTLIYIGENKGGCTGDDTFFNLVYEKTKLNNKITYSLQESSLSWTGIHDTWNVFEVQ